MDPERWHLLGDIFHKALDHEPGSRAAFLDEICGKDPALRAEVSSLFAYHEQANAVIDTPTHLIGAQLSENDQTESLVGQSLHQYVVRQKLGEGGMGVVYLADDTRLSRRVAIKALARRFTQNTERRERLRREARAAAGLSHPGIATVYALEEFDDNLYIISEFVPGLTLREEVAKGPLPIGVVLNTGVEVLRALVAAHGQGVIHRDLKPENVIRTPDGSVKVLDFGLARMLGAHAGGVEASRTRLTEPGAILGTPGYMPPEQLRGNEVDARADIFSFGVLLYELASGAHPFTSSNPASTIARVLESEPPDVTQLSPSCPAGLDQIISKCLQKEPAQRFSSSSGLLDALEQLRRDVAESEAVRAASKSPLKTAEKPRRSPKSPLWWWQFHQAVVGVGYYLVLIPAWGVRGWMPGSAGSLLFFALVAAVGVAATLRFHLWFTSQNYRSELTTQRGQSFRWIRGADWLFVGLLVVIGALLAAAHAAYAALFVGIAVGSFIGVHDHRTRHRARRLQAPPLEVRFSRDAEAVQPKSSEES